VALVHKRRDVKLLKMYPGLRVARFKRLGGAASKGFGVAQVSGLACGCIQKEEIVHAFILLEVGRTAQIR
jgi:hypothetical protein